MKESLPFKDYRITIEFGPDNNRSELTFNRELEARVFFTAKDHWGQKPRLRRVVILNNLGKVN